MRWTSVFPLLLAMVAGGLMPTQGATNALLSRQSTLAMATFWVHATAAAGVGLLLILLPSMRGSWSNLLGSPTIALLGGLMGIAITWLVASAVGQVGMVAATTSILLAQVTTAVLLDHFGLFGLDTAPFSWNKGVGAGLLVLGAWLLFRK